MPAPFLSDYNGLQVDNAVMKAFLLTNYTLFTGGSSVALDSIATVDMAVGERAVVLSNDTLFPYVLKAGTDAEASPNIIRPDDYAGGTNEKVWQLIRGHPSLVAGGVDLADDVDGATIADLDLPSVPQVVIPIMQIPESSGLTLIPVIQGTPTADGFTVYFQGGPTDSTGYRLNYLIFL